MCSYYGASPSLIMVVVYCSFQSLLESLRLALASVLTLAATFDAGAVVHQRALLHGASFPSPVSFDSIFAPGLDYDIFLVSRIAELRLQLHSNRSSIFKRVLATFQQFEVDLIVSVLLSTFISRTVLVPAMLLVAQSWSRWQGIVAPAIHDSKVRFRAWAR